MAAYEKELRGFIMDTLDREVILTPQASERLDEVIQEVLNEEATRKAKRTKEELCQAVIQKLVEDSHEKRGDLTELSFLKCIKRLEEAILRIAQESKKAKPPGTAKFRYKNIFGKWKADQTKDLALRRNYDFSGLLYLHLGLCGGAYAIADQERNQIIVQHNRKLQPEFEAEYRNTPFINIAYRYTYRSQESIKQTRAYRRVLDAIYISSRRRQALNDKDNPWSPEFYQYLPHLLSETNRQRMVPAERNFSDNNFKFIYCTVGEVLFHLFAWRLLFRHIQHHDLGAELKPDGNHYFYINNANFWERMKGLASSNELNKLPEVSWAEALEERFKNKLADDRSESMMTIPELWAKKFEGKIDVPQRGVVDHLYSFEEEFYNLGLIKRIKKNEDKETNTGAEYFTRDFLEMIRYAIHVAKRHLEWPRSKSIRTKDSLAYLEKVESRLGDYYRRCHINKEFKHKETAPGFPHPNRFRGICGEQMDQKNEKATHYLTSCLQKIIYEYLSESLSGSSNHTMESDEPQESLYGQLKKLHRKCRFPIIPYYYELASGDNHTPKEHLVFCLWDSNEDPLKIRPIADNQEREETGVAFVLLTIHPIWRIKEHYHLVEAGKSLIDAEKLSDECQIRLLRLYQFFSFLGRPIIDSGFYDRLVKRRDRADIVESEITSFSHELGKTTQQIFSNSHNSLSELYGDGAAQIATILSERIPGDRQPDIKDVMEWRIIPNIKHFRSWSYNLLLWAGNEKELLLSNDVGDRTLRGILKKCESYAKHLYVGSQVFRNSTALKSYREVVEYEDNFRFEKERLAKLNIEFEEDFLGDLFMWSTTEANLHNNQKNKINRSQSALVRLFIATIVNIYEHNLSGTPYRLRVKKGRWEKDTKVLSFQFTNRYDPHRSGNIDPHSPRRGTYPVLKTCLRMIGDYPTELQFRPLRAVPDKRLQANQNKESMEPSSDIWETSFAFAVGDIFRNIKNK
ncbi:MAG: hypothetical protein AAFQ92_18380 [Bacteroidota bacterium]